MLVYAHMMGGCQVCLLWIVIQQRTAHWDSCNIINGQRERHGNQMVGLNQIMRKEEREGAFKLIHM
jgi:hypothetical protein